MKDQYGRNINYMRISITDRCNLRCRYCMPEDIQTTGMSQILTYEEIEEVIRAGVRLGITHYRITGGEPLVRKGCVELIARITQVKGVEKIKMTTNGVLLGQYAKDLKEAGLDGVNVSLDTVDAASFQAITGRDSMKQVIEGIMKAKEVGLSVKINTVNQIGLDYHSVLTFGNQYGIPVRFIEMMPIGHGKEYVGQSNEELIHNMQKQYGLAAHQDATPYGDGPAVYYHFPGLSIPVGFISAMNHQFCENCNRIRFTAEGYMKLCLCFNKGVDLRAVLRSKESDQLKEVMKKAIYEKPREHCFWKAEDITEAKEMVCIGG